jgi:hypothetical protein
MECHATVNAVHPKELARTPSLATAAVNMDIGLYALARFLELTADRLKWFDKSILRQWMSIEVRRL